MQGATRPARAVHADPPARGHRQGAPAARPAQPMRRCKRARADGQHPSRLRAPRPPAGSQGRADARAAAAPAGYLRWHTGRAARPRAAVVRLGQRRTPPLGSRARHDGSPHARGSGGLCLCHGLVQDQPVGQRAQRHRQARHGCRRTGPGGMAGRRRNRPRPVVSPNPARRTCGRRLVGCGGEPHRQGALRAGGAGWQLFRAFAALGLCHGSRGAAGAARRNHGHDWPCQRVDSGPLFPRGRCTALTRGRPAGAGCQRGPVSDSPCPPTMRRDRRKYGYFASRRLWLALRGLPILAGARDSAGTGCTPRAEYPADSHRGASAGGTGARPRTAARTRYRRNAERWACPTNNSSPRRKRAAQA
ncbi:protein of unknown function [Cupriavidus taiwanensis]|nr:protein of unknown function [Cupriavidus taiwanensis]SOZ12659.1 protein of unknown function [Cupriavidus taiwanensis]